MQRRPFNTPAHTRRLQLLLQLFEDRSLEVQAATMRLFSEAEALLATRKSSSSERVTVTEGAPPPRNAGQQSFSVNGRC